MATIYTVTEEEGGVWETPIHQQSGGKGPRWYASMKNTENARLLGPAVAMAVPNGKAGISTTGLNGCVGLVYAFRPGGEYKLIVLAHVNCGAYHSVRGLFPPMTMARQASLTVEPEEIYVVASVGYHNEKYESDLEELIGGDLPEKNVFIYVGRGQNWIVNTDGVVGELGASKGRAPVVIEMSDRDTVRLLDESDSVTATPRCCCYLTTAACAALGGGDDCHELQVLRWFRDAVLLRDERGERDVAQYYATAPVLVAAIDATTDPRATYLEIFHGTIRPAVAGVLAGRHAEAHALYRRMVSRLEARFGVRSA